MREARPVPVLGTAVRPSAGKSRLRSPHAAPRVVVIHCLSHGPALPCLGMGRGGAACTWPRARLPLRHVCARMLLKRPRMLLKRAHTLLKRTHTLLKRALTCCPNACLPPLPVVNWPSRLASSFAPSAAPWASAMSWWSAASVRVCPAAADASRRQLHRDDANRFAPFSCPRHDQAGRRAGEASPRAGCYAGAAGRAHDRRWRL